MGTKAFLIVGGSSGIGFEIVSALMEQGHEIHVASPTGDRLSGFKGVHHLRLDVTDLPENVEGSPEAISGLVYCPGTMRL
jgi:3-oxoacyl-[acyl-carrier protein] reductase